MNKRKNIYFNIVMPVLAVVLVGYYSINYSGFFMDFMGFLCFVSGGLGIFTIVSPLFLSDVKIEELSKEEIFYLFFYHILYGLIIAFGFFYSRR